MSIMNLVVCALEASYVYMVHAQKYGELVDDALVVDWCRTKEFLDIHVSLLFMDLLCGFDLAR